MSLKYVDPNALNENRIKTQEYVESVRSALDSAKQNVMQYASLPQASETWENKIVEYTGTTTATLTSGYFYVCKAVVGSDPTTYEWVQQAVQDEVAVDGTTITRDQSTGQLSAVPATNSSKGIVQHGDGTEIGADGEINVVDRLVVTATMPVASESLLNATRLFIGTSATYRTGGIYQCQSDGEATPTYSWVLISTAEVDLSDYKKTFLGTTAEWNAKTTAQKVEFDEADLSDDLGGGMVVSTVPAVGDHNPIESEAVYNLGQDKADKVSNATNGNFAGLDANGNLTDSGKKASDFLTQHQDISGKADKVQSPTANNFAALNANGNLTDSGKKASDFVAKTTYTSHIANNGSKNFLAMRLGDLKGRNVTGAKWDGNTYIGSGMTFVCNLVPNTDIVESFTISGATNSTTPFSFVPICNEMNFNGKAVTVAMIADVTNSNIRVTAYGTNYLYANTTQQRYNYTPTSNVWGSQIYVGRSVTISNPVTFKLMICLQSDYDFDPTWVAPIRNNFQLEQDIKDIHNAIAVNYAPRKEAGEYTNQGITYTVNDDGTVTLTDGTVTTTPSGFTLGKVKGLVHGKKYRLSGLPSPVGNCFIKMYNQSWSNTMEISSGNLEQVFTYDEATAINNLQVGIRVVGTAADNQVFKPMITPVDYDGPYVPCTLSNEDLTSFIGEWQIVDPLMAFTVTGDGEKTYGEILSELYTQINDAIHALKPGERLAVNRLRNSSNTDIPCNNPCSYFLNTENLGSMTFSGSYLYNAPNNEIGVWLIYLHPTASSCRMIWYKVGASGIMSYNAHVDDVFPSGNKLSVRATKYRGPKI